MYVIPVSFKKSTSGVSSSLSSKKSPSGSVQVSPRKDALNNLQRKSEWGGFPSARKFDRSKDKEIKPLEELPNQENTVKSLTQKPICKLCNLCSRNYKQPNLKKQESLGHKPVLNEGSINKDERDFYFVVKLLNNEKIEKRGFNLTLIDTCFFANGEPRIIAFHKEHTIKFIKRKDRMSFQSLRLCFQERAKELVENSIKFKGKEIILFRFLDGHEEVFTEADFANQILRGKNLWKTLEFIQLGLNIASYDRKMHYVHFIYDESKNNKFFERAENEAMITIENVPHASFDYVSTEEEIKFEKHLLAEEIHQYFYYTMMKLQQLIEKIYKIRLTEFVSQFQTDSDGGCFLVNIFNLEWQDLNSNRGKFQFFRLLREDPWSKITQEMENNYKEREINEMRGLLTDIFIKDYYQKRRIKRTKLKINLENPEDILKNENLKQIHPRNFFKVEEILRDSSQKNIDDLNIIINKGLSPRSSTDRTRSPNEIKSQSNRYHYKKDELKSHLQSNWTDSTPKKEHAAKEDQNEYMLRRSFKHQNYERSPITIPTSSRQRSPLISPLHSPPHSERSILNTSDSFVKIKYICNSPLDIRFLKLKKNLLGRLLKSKKGEEYFSYL